MKPPMRSPPPAALAQPASGGATAVGVERVPSPGLRPGTTHDYWKNLLIEARSPVAVLAGVLGLGPSP